MNFPDFARSAFIRLTAAMLCTTLTACMVSPASKSSLTYRPFYADPEKRIPNTAGMLPEIVTPALGKTIAVADIAYKQEFREFFYDEKATSKTETLELPPPMRPAAPLTPNGPAAPAQPTVPPEAQGPAGPLPQHIPDPANIRNRSSLERRAYLQSVLFRTAQAAESDIHPSAPNPPPPDAAGAASPTPGARSTRNEYTYSKRYGIERKVSYGELRGVASDIRALLIKSGYRVVAGRPAVEKPLQDDHYLDILARIRAGDFAGADYVLFGVLTEIALSEHNEPIVGTRNTMQSQVLDLAVDFSLIDTQSSQVVASFLAVGSGRENRIDGKAAGYKASLARLVKQASLAMAEDVALGLNSQNLTISAAALPPAAGSAETAGASTKRRLDEDSRSLRIYR